MCNRRRDLMTTCKPPFSDRYSPLERKRTGRIPRPRMSRTSCITLIYFGLMKLFIMPFIKAG